MKQLFLIILLVFLLGCQQQVDQDTTTNTNEIKTEEITTNDEMPKETQKLTFENVKKHNSEDDCWLLIDGKVYDVTDFIASHPGGKAILQGCGKEATDLYETRPMGSGTPHSSRARSMLDDYYIGNIE